jgi:thymidine kinase
VTGRVEVVSGPMFAGKTEELLRRVRRAQVGGRRVLLVDHVLDTRRGSGTVSSHSGQSLASRTVHDAHELEAVARAEGPWDLVAVDEAQFFGPALVDVVQRLADDGSVVVVAGLDVTYDARPFEPLPGLSARAERVDRLTAVCAVCGEDAAFHVRTGAVATTPAGDAEGDAGDALVADASHVGGSERYEARCRTHLVVAPWRRGTAAPEAVPTAQPGASSGGSSTSGTNE